MPKKIILFIFVTLLLTSCSLFKNSNGDDHSDQYFDIKLSEVAADRNAEYSGLCWYENNLIMLPQYPSYFNKILGYDTIFMLSQDLISDTIKRKGKRVVAPAQIKVINNKAHELLPGYEGFEGICYDGEFFYLSIEYNATTNQGAIVKARLSEDETELEILNDEHLILDLPSNVFNASYESIFFYDNHIYLIYEANGKRINRNPIAKRISRDFQTVEDVAFEAIEYRITDVTAFDEEGKGWAINYFFPGDLDHYLPDEDFIPNNYVAENNTEIGIERLIPLRVMENKIEYDNSRKPIYIKKEKRDISYNWEGVVKYHNNSFFIATDKYPQTVLRFLKTK